MNPRIGDGDTRRARRAIVKALRRMPAPAPPEGLRACLLAPVAGDAGPTKWSKWRRPVLVTGTALAAIAVWPASCSVFGPAGVDTPSGNSIGWALQPAPASPLETAPSPNQTGLAAKSRKEEPESHPVRVLTASSRPHPRTTLFAAPEGGMTVTVGHANPSSVGTASAAVLTTDADGNAVTKEWELKDGPDEDREELTLSDDQGRQGSITVDVPAHESNPKGAKP